LHAVVSGDFRVAQAQKTRGIIVEDIALLLFIKKWRLLDDAN